MAVADREFSRDLQGADPGVPVRERGSVGWHEGAQILLAMDTGREKALHEHVQPLNHRLADLWLAK